MAGHPFALEEAFDRMGGDPDVKPLLDELVGYGVVVVIHLDMVVDMYPGLLPFSVGVEQGGQLLEHWFIQCLEHLPARPRKLLEGEPPGPCRSC